MLDLFYNNPLWLVGSLVVLLPVVLTVGLLKLFLRYVPQEVRTAHNEYTGYIIAVIGINYAVLIAFVAVAVWGSYDKASGVASREADLAGNMYRDAPGLGPDMAKKIRAELKSYVHTVVKEEWPAMARSEQPRAAWRQLENIQDALAAYQPQNAGQGVYMQEVLHGLNELYDARRERIAASAGGVEPVVWTIVLLGTALTIGFTFMFGMPSARMHMVMTGGFTAAAMLVLVLIIAFDWPFRGEVQVAPSMFQHVIENMEALDARNPQTG
jgi:hypothetical protein